MTLTEGSLHKWFKGSKSKDGKPGWVNVKTGGTCASDEPGEGTPKCVSSSKRASMSKAERDSASRRKKAADPNQQSKTGAAKPTYVSTDKKKMKENVNWQKFTEKCWDGYTQKGMKKKGKRVVPNCVKEDEVVEAKVDQGRSDYGKASIRNYRRSGPGHGEPAMFDPENKRGKLIDKRREEHKARRGVKGAKVPAYKTEEVVTEADKKGKGSGSKDACYHKVKASAKVWPSAYASGRLVQCRKKGAANYGNSKKESYSWRDDFEFVQEGAAWTKKEGQNKEGGLNEKGRKSYERDNPGSDLKAPSKKVGNKRRASFCARMKGMRKRQKPSNNTGDDRLSKSLRAWNC